MHTQDTLRTMERYRIGRVVGPWQNLKPPIQGGRFERSEKVGSNNHNAAWDTDPQDSGIDCDTSSDSSSIDCSPKLQPYKRLPHNFGPAIERLDSAIDLPTTLPSENTACSPADYVANTVRDKIDVDLAKYPALDFDTQRSIALKFQALHQRVKDEGFYECRFIEYGKEMIRYAGLFALFILTLRQGWYFVSACFLGLFWHQIMFTAHDAGHRGITRNITIGTIIGIFIADLCCGLSIGWWKSSHNVHHLLTNAPVHKIAISKIGMPKANADLTGT